MRNKLSSEGGYVEELLVGIVFTIALLIFGISMLPGMIAETAQAQHPQPSVSSNVAR